MILSVLSSIHDGWVKDNPQKFFARDKKYQHMPMELIGWDEVKSDLLFLAPIVEAMNLEVEEEKLEKAYDERVKSFFETRGINGLKDLPSHIAKGSEFYPALEGQTDIQEALRDPKFVSETMIPSIMEKGIGADKSAKNAIGKEKRTRIIKKLIENPTVVTHFGDDLDNKAAIEALTGLFTPELKELISFKGLNVERVPAGQIKQGMLNIDTGGHKGSRFEEDGTIVIDGDPENGIKSACEALDYLGIYVPKQIIELADTVPNKVSPLDSRSGLALVRYLRGEDVFRLAEANLLDKSLTDEQLEEFDLMRST